MSENYKWFFGFWITVASFLILLDFGYAGWLNWTGEASGWLAAGTIVLALAAVVTLRIVYSGAKVALESLADAKKTRHGLLVTDLSRRWNEERIVESQALYSEASPIDMIELAERVNVSGDAKNELQVNKDAREKYVEAVQSFNKLLAFPTLLDTIGVLVDEDVIDPKVVYKLWGPTIALVWKTWNTEVDGRTPVETLRQEWGSPTAYRYFESLGRKMALLDAAELFTAAASSQ